MRIGFGYDVHPLVPGRRLVIGGVIINHTHGLGGHSDADVLAHAIGDALLGAANLGDLGTHFPDTTQNFAGISSLLLLKEIARLLRRHQYQISNLDTTVVLETPKIMQYAPAMRENLANSLGISASQISIKATTSEKLGFIGRKDGAVAYAVVLIENIADT